MGAQEHLLDRLMTKATRRQMFKMVAAGAAALTLSVKRPGTALADDSSACQTGCLYYYGVTSYYAGLAQCDQQYRNSGSPIAGASFAALGSLSIFGALLTTPLASSLDKKVRTSAWLACRDQAVLESKAHSYDCLKAGCPGFSPKAPGGPCVNCTQNCCPCTQIPIGYICCFYACDDPDHSCC